jgi:hypothetical protein
MEYGVTGKAAATTFSANQNKNMAPNNFVLSLLYTMENASFFFQSIWSD